MAASCGCTFLNSCRVPVGRLFGGCIFLSACQVDVYWLYLACRWLGFCWSGLSRKEEGLPVRWSLLQAFSANLSRYLLDDCLEVQRGARGV